MVLVLCVLFGAELVLLILSVILGAWPVAIWSALLVLVLGVLLVGAIAKDPRP